MHQAHAVQYWDGNLRVSTCWSGLLLKLSGELVVVTATGIAFQMEATISDKK